MISLKGRRSVFIVVYTKGHESQGGAIGREHPQHSFPGRRAAKMSRRVGKRFKLVICMIEKLYMYTYAPVVFFYCGPDTVFAGLDGRAFGTASSFHRRNKLPSSPQSRQNEKNINSSIAKACQAQCWHFVEELAVNRIKRKMV